MNAWLHSDSINGAPITLGVNQPLAAAPQPGLRSALGKFQAEHGVSHLLIQHGLVWGTQERATLIGNQVLNWPLAENTLLIWPLDHSVWSCQLISTQFVLIDEGSERIDSSEKAVELVEESGMVIVVAGGLLTNYLTDAGYPPTPGYELSPDVMTQPAVWVYTRHRLLHRLHMWLLAGALAVAGSLVLAVPLVISQAADPGGPPRVVLTPKGRPELGPQLSMIAAAVNELEVLQLHGADEVDLVDESLVVSGRLEDLDENRLQAIARAWGTEAAIAGTEWTLAYPLPVLSIDGQNLVHIHDETENLARLGRSATFEVEKEPPKNNAVGRYSTTQVVLSADGYLPTAPMHALAETLHRRQPPLTATLRQWHLDLTSKGQGELRMVTEVRGQPVEQGGQP